MRNVTLGHSNHKVIPKLTEKQLQRVWSKVHTGSSSTCWEWAAGKSNGYGTVSINGRTYFAHRVVYYIHYGIDPGEMLVCHTCDNPGCCNPSHLFLGTCLDNNRDRTKKGRSAPQTGEHNKQAKLTENDIEAIRNSKEAHHLLETRHKTQQISAIKTGKTWKHTDGKREKFAAKTNNQTGVRGVYPCNGSYRAHITHQGKRYYLGSFTTIREAERAIKAKRRT